jgi:ABC-type arginine transport system permease subunit
MAHVFFGVTCILASVWVFVDALNAGANPASAGRIKIISLAAAAAMWLAFVMGGYWYVVFYAADKAVILKGPWPFAHSYFMETKEHLVSCCCCWPLIYPSPPRMISRAIRRRADSCSGWPQ